MSNTNVTTCDTCGSIRDLNDTFCGNCGRPLGIHAPEETYPTETHREVKQTAATQLSKPTPQVYTPEPLLRSQSKLRLFMVIAVLLVLLVGLGGFALGQVVKGNPQGKISNTPLPSNHSGTIIANTAQVSTTFSSTMGCPTSGGYFKIVNVSSGLVLDVPDGSLASGTAIQQYPYVGTLQQKWQCVPVGQGYFQIVNRNSGLVLDVPSTSSHSPLLQDSYSGGSNQQWRFVSSN